MEKQSQFMQEIRCPTCGKQGHATWATSGADGELRHLASLSEGFESLSAANATKAAITCQACGTPQPD
jgi:ribosomal protein L37E